MEQLWIVRAGRHGERESPAIEENKLFPGFIEVGDLSTRNSRDEIFEHLQEVLSGLKFNALRNFAAQLNQFANKIKKGDYVVMPRKGTNEVAIGIVTGSYKYDDNSPYKHSLAVDWKNESVSRNVFKQDLRHSLGAFLTICEVKRNNALERIKSIVETGKDPGNLLGEQGKTLDSSNNDDTDSEADDHLIDIKDEADQQIISLIKEEFSGHALSELVAEIMRAEGYTTKVSPPGPDGGVDILAIDGKFGLGKDKICVQVKSGEGPANVDVVRLLRDSVSTTKAQSGLLVSIGGVNKAARSELEKDFFTIRLWKMPELLEALFKTYGELSDETRTKLPLKRIWIPVPPDDS